MGTKKTTTHETQHATTTPNVEGWIKGPNQDYMARVQQFMGSDPMQYIAGPSALQKAVFGLSGGILDRVGKRMGMPEGQWWPQAGQRSGTPLSPASAPVEHSPAAVPAVMPQQPNSWQQYATQTDPRIQQQMDLLRQNLTQAGGYPNGLFDWMK